mgnify:FL=1
MKFRDYLTKEQIQQWGQINELRRLFQHLRKKRLWTKFDRTSCLQIEWSNQLKTLLIVQNAKFLNRYDQSIALIVKDVSLVTSFIILRQEIVWENSIDAII